MKTISNRIVIVVVAIGSFALRACSPVIVAPAPRPRPVVIATPPPPPPPVVVPVEPVIQPVVVQPVVPVWAPPYPYIAEVHYYYFPDYCVYYSVFTRQYVYFNGYSWLHVAVLPAIPLYAGFSPYNSYLVVLNRYTADPWVRHSYYTQQYPREYYNTVYAPRQPLASNTRLRAYDENQSRPVFTDRATNKEVTVKYDVRQAPRTAPAGNNTPSQSNTRSTPRTATNYGIATENPASRQAPRPSTNGNNTPVVTAPARREAVVTRENPAAPIQPASNPQPASSRQGRTTKAQPQRPTAPAQPTVRQPAQPAPQPVVREQSQAPASPARSAQSRRSR